jgi:hypothetical protein
MKNRRNKSFSSYERTTKVSAPAGVKKVGKFWAVGAVVLVGLVMLARGDTPKASADAPKPAAVAVVKKQAVLKPFPVIDTSSLTSVQKRLLKIVKEEYYKRPTGSDATVMKYTEGVDESWCADFISWVRDQAGIPWTHPETKYWRISGVGTVKDYYMVADAYFEADRLDGYVPKLGDVLFYFGETPDGGSSEHIAMVLSVEDDKVTTIGGNETEDEILQVRTNKLQLGERGLVAVGRTAVN